MKVLITCGPTWVPIDDVRVISNISSGEMGHVIAEELKNAGAHVTMIEGAVTHAWNPQGIRVIKYQYLKELEKIFKAELKHTYDYVIHAAAVSDFEVKGSTQGKMDSRRKRNLSLSPTRKLINDVKRISPDSFLVGFKLEPGMNTRNVFDQTRTLFSESGCDLVIANSLKPRYQAFICDADGQILASSKNKKQTAKELIKIIC